MTTKRFRVAFSFAGEQREFVAKVAAILAQRFGEAAILYDKFHKAEFSRSDLAFYLPELYEKEADLVVAVFCPGYDQKEWCGLEWNAIFGLLKARKVGEVMLTRFQRVDGKGLHGLAGYTDLDDETPESAATLILERLALNQGHSKDHYTKATTANPPALRSSTPNNLPRHQPFFGRENELAEIAAALDPASRTWGTLIDGAGGVGKTALAIEAAYRCPPDSYDHIVFVSLKQQELDDSKLRRVGGFALSSWMEMLNEIARVLDLPEIPTAPEDNRARRMKEALEKRRVLLVLDNLESLSEPEQDQLFTFLQYLPATCKALLTSRTFVGNRLQAIDLKQLDQTSALRMLAEIAKHNAAFAKSSESDRIRLHEQTQGNALLLRWVAGQVGCGRCTGVADALSFLRTCPPGNDPLSFIFDLVVASLSNAEIRILSVLTYPTQPIPIAAISDISGVPAADCHRLLKSLANRSLVVPDQEERAFSLVPMVADFLCKGQPEVVRETGERLEKRAYALIVDHGYQQYHVFPVIEAAWPTVAPALALFLSGPNERLQELCRAIKLFLDFTGRWDERISLCQGAEAKAEQEGDFPNAGYRAYEIGWMHFRRNQKEEVFACAVRTKSHWKRARGRVAEPGFAPQILGLANQLAGDYRAAIKAYRKAEMLHRRHSKTKRSRNIAMALYGVARSTRALARSTRSLHQLKTARRVYEQALRIAKTARDIEYEAMSTGDLAALALDRKAWSKAEALARQALDLSERMGRQDLIALDCRRLANAVAQQGRKAEGLDYARRAVEIYAKLGSRRVEEAEAALAECEGTSNETGTQTPA